MIKRTIMDCFEETVKTFPDKIAFADTDTEISFLGLWKNACAVASFLLEKYGDRKVVAFYTDKSVKTVIGFLGAAYAGMAYTQINLRFPASRVETVINTVMPCVLITDEEHEQSLKQLNLDCNYVVIEKLLETSINEDALKTKRRGILDIDPLYINFTSGSTGIPKGVAVCHRSVLDFVEYFVDIFHITSKDTIGNQAPFDFDVSVKDIYSGLFTGATVQIIPTSYFLQPIKLMDFLCDREISILIWAVSALCFITTMNALDYRIPTKIRSIMFSGEVMPVKHLNKLKQYLPDAQYVNLYGPTEITCNCTYYIINREFENSEKLPIGIPFPNERIIILDDDNREVNEPGSNGELCVSGTSVTLGYYGNNERTQEVFVRNPNNSFYNETIYKTGDIVHIADNGELYYISRKDFQVKHMGHRIELTEIEMHINSLVHVDRACCLFNEKKDKVIAVYIGECEKTEIVKQLQMVLPQYMLPQALYKIDTFPLNKNGKIDRKALEEKYF